MRHAAEKEIAQPPAMEVLRWARHLYREAPSGMMVADSNQAVSASMPARRSGGSSTRKFRNRP